jgi:phosphoribosyl 1,2-cyclic phosphate phosphodiesterase
MRETLREMSSVFAYAFRSNGANESAIPLVLTHEIDTEPFDVGTMSFLPLPLMHGKMRVNGYRIGNFAYCTDCNFITDEALDRMQDLDVLILDALRLSRHPTHFSLEEAIEAAENIGARRTYFTHIAHDIKHSDVEAILPESLRLAYDGLEVIVDN